MSTTKGLIKYSIKDISRISGVSIATLSRYFNGQKVNKNNEEKIRKVIKETGYTPNIAARMMKGGASGVIGLIVPEITHPFFSMIAEGVMEEARNNNQLVLCSSSCGSVDVEHVIIDQFSQSVIDGLIYIPVAQAHYIPQIERFTHIPMVVTARENVFSDTTHIYHDNEKGGYLATKYMLQLGRDEVVFIASFWGTPPCTNENIYEFLHTKDSHMFSSLERFRGYIKALEEYGIPYNPSLVIVTGYANESGSSSVLHLVENFVSFNAIIAMTQTVANGVVYQLKNQGFVVPQDVSIIIFDVSESKANYTFSNIELHLYEMGRKSVIALNKRIRKEPIEDVCLDVSLCIRDTTVSLEKSR